MEALEKCTIKCTIWPSYSTLSPHTTEGCASVCSCCTGPDDKEMDSRWGWEMVQQLRTCCTGVRVEAWGPRAHINVGWVRQPASNSPSEDTAG